MTQKKSASSAALAGIMQRSTLFGGFHIQSLRDLLREFRQVTYGPSDMVFEEGGESESMLVLLAGTLGVFRGNRQIAVITPVDIVGEMGLISGSPRSAAVQVIGDENAIVLEMTAKALKRIHRDDSDTAATLFWNIAAVLSQRLDVANKAVAELLEAAQAPAVEDDGKHGPHSC